MIGIGASKLVIKAQVLAGGRGKGHFAGPGGLQGGVHMVDTSVPPTRSRTQLPLPFLTKFRLVSYSVRNKRVITPSR